MENKRDEFRRVMREWFTEWNSSESRNDLEGELRYTFEHWGIRYEGIRPFGETLRIGWSWESEGVKGEININPKGNPFRVLFKFKPMELGHE